MSGQAGVVTSTWYWLGWRARIAHAADEVAIEQALLAVENALEADDHVYQRPMARRLTTDSVRFELWTAASTDEIAIRGTRLVLREALRNCGVGDPLLAPGQGRPPLSLMFEEWPKVRRQEDFERP